MGVGVCVCLCTGVERKRATSTVFNSIIIARRAFPVYTTSLWLPPNEVHVFCSTLNLQFLAQRFFGSADAVSKSGALGFAILVQHVDLPLKA